MSQDPIEFDLPERTATEALARALAQRARPGDVIALHGDLGAGKTTFAADKDVYAADAARALTLAGKVEEAKKLWSELASRRESPVVAEARVRLGELEGKK